MVVTLIQDTHGGTLLGQLVGDTSDASSLELTAAKKDVDLSKYQLEQVERNNCELAKELGFSEKTRREAQEIINHRDDELKRAEERIEDLDRQRSRVERDWHHARDDLKRLRRTLREKRSRDHASSKAHSRRSPNGSSAKRAKSSKKESHSERTPQREERSAFGRVQTTPEPFVKL
uniref:Uncharacterized protein LOC105033787 n=1 Tax=Elaeis guineensis var. tenera TaxID=51953 RepID=A0A6I9QCB9_ELAGV|nr:uncharacterized protein LOC105033787 [Elaeis guineensis]